MAVEIAAIVTLVTAVTGLVTALLLLAREIRRVHELVNSRMTELLDLTRTSSIAQGKLAGPDKGREDQPSRA